MTAIRSPFILSRLNSYEKISYEHPLRHKCTQRDPSDLRKIHKCVNQAPAFLQAGAWSFLESHTIIDIAYHGLFSL